MKVERQFMWKYPQIEFRTFEIHYELDPYDSEEIYTDSIEIYEGSRDLTDAFDRLDRMACVSVWDMIKEEINNYPTRRDAGKTF
jgi:hypothetical protein